MVKSFIYRIASKTVRLYWHIIGGRRLTVFGQDLRVTADTNFPTHRNLRLPKGGALSKIVRYTDFVQIHSLCRYVSGLQEKPTIIDVGAYHGAYAIVMGKIAQKFGVKVIAIEPNPTSYAVLTKNIALNRLQDTVTCAQVAVLDQPGHARIERNGSESHLTNRSTSCSCEVEVWTLADLLDKHGIQHVDVLLIDVEGAELPVLRGFCWESATVGRVFCELHPYA